MKCGLDFTDELEPQIRWSAESHIRDGLAEFARLAGWGASTEWIVQGWGRPDLYLRAGLERIAVEVKTKLRTPSQCRKAIQQAASYRRAMPEVSLVALVASEINADAMADYKASYPEVWVLTVGEFMSYLENASSTYHHRQESVAEEMQRLERKLEAMRALHRRAFGVGDDVAIHVAGCLREGKVPDLDASGQLEDGRYRPVRFWTHSDFMVAELSAHKSAIAAKERADEVTSAYEYLAKAFQEAGALMVGELFEEEKQGVEK